MTTSVSGSSYKFKIAADRRAQMPFSVIAVLLLVVSSASIALLYGIDSQGDAARIPQEKLGDMTAAMDAAVEDVVRIAYASALDSIKGTVVLNSTELHERFLSSLDPALARSYPKVSGDIRSSVAHNISLTFLRASLQESFGGGTVWQGSSVPAYFIINGNYSLEIACDDGKLTRTVELDQDVLVPLPLLAYKLERMNKAAAPMGEIETIVQYELSALAQDRVLRGYGSGARTGAEGTEEIITPEDVVRAVNLAVLLEELRYFQDIGAVSGDLAAIAPEIEGLEGEADPADLFLRSYQDGGLDLASIVGQALYARADSIVLKWMDYLGLIDLVGLGEAALEMGEDNLFAVIDLLTGGDHDQVVMSEYIANAMAEAGYQQYDYRWYCYGGGDILVHLPSFRITVFDDRGRAEIIELKGTYALDVPQMDVLSSPAWAEVRQDYRSETRAIAEAMRSFVETIAAGIASNCHLPPLDLKLDPTDGRTYLQEIDEQLAAAFRDGSGWIQPAIDRADEVRTVREGLAQAAMDYLDRNWMEMFQVNTSLTRTAWDLSAVLAQEKLGTDPDYSQGALAKVRDRIYLSLTNENWGAWDVMLAELMEGRLGPLLNKLDHALSMQTEGSIDLVTMLTDAMTSTTGLGLMTALMVKDTMDGFGDSLAAQGGGYAVPIASGGMTLDLADGHRRVESVVLDSKALELSEDGRPGSLQVSVKMPWQYDRSHTSYPNRHVTDVGAMTATPYLAQWEVRYAGGLELTARSDGSAVPPCSSFVPLLGAFTVVAFSGWSLEGVEYAPSATLRSDVQDLLTGLYDMIASAAQVVGGLADQLFMLLYRLITDLFSCSTGALGSLEELLASGTGALEDLITGSMGQAISLLADGASAIMGGTTIDLHVLGLALSVVFAPGDSALAGTEDRMRIDIGRSFAGTSFSSSFRVLRLPDGDHTIAVSMGLEADDWSVDLTIDPLTKIYEHVVELRGYMGQYMIELCAPEVQRVQKVSLSLSDIPGVGDALKSIPSPVPGTKWHVDAGMEMSFNILGRSGLVINEVELNPQGADRSREWVELYNPSGEAVDLTGYALVTSRGDVHREVLSGSIQAYGHLVHQFSGQALDNGDVKDFPLQESVTLLDRNGKRVDAAPWLRDLDDDARTWQRSYDGASEWELRTGSRGSSNGPVLLTEQSIEGLKDLIVTSFKESFEEQMSGPLDMSLLRDIVAGAMSRIADRMLDSVERTISVLRFYLELGLDDLTGSAGGGINMGLEYDGRAVRDCLEWFIGAIGAVMNDPLNPLSAGSRAPVPAQTLADHVFVQMGGYMEVRMPDLVRGIAEAKLTVLGTIRISLGSLGLIGGGSGTEVEFGVVASALMGEKVSLGVGQSASACYDVWLIKGTLRMA